MNRWKENLTKNNKTEIRKPCKRKKIEQNTKSQRINDTHDTEASNYDFGRRRNESAAVFKERRESRVSGGRLLRLERSRRNTDIYLQAQTMSTNCKKRMKIVWAAWPRLRSRVLIGLAPPLICTEFNYISENLSCPF